MPVKRKDKEGNNHNTPSKNKKIRQEKDKEKGGDFSDDDLSDIDDDGEIFNGIRIPAELPPVRSAEETLGPRMIITHIVANNFKSYFGEITIGPFHKSLTSIVGANGSGKSNVIDSLLFVFGYRSTKIRSKKVSVLIHKSDRHKDVRQCSVTVHFVQINDDANQDTGYVAVPGSEVTITRTAFKDNTSNYTLNNKRVKFKDVATVLKKNGIDLIHNRFLILQGEVEQIAMMKPKAENEHTTGMLEYLEDVIGTARYKKPLEKLAEKMQVLGEEKNEKISRLKFIAKERDELIEPVEAAIRHLKLENQLTQLENKKFQKQMAELNKLIATKTEDQNSIKDKLNCIEDELASIAESKKNKEGALRSLTDKLKGDIKKKDSVEKKLKVLLNEDLQLKSDLTQINDQIKKYEKSIKTEENKITKAQGVPKIKEAELVRLKSNLAPLEEECLKLETNYTKVNSSGFEKSKKFREEKDLLAPEELKLQKIVGGKQNQVQTLKTEFEVLLDTEKSEKAKLSKLEEQLVTGTEEYKNNLSKKEKAEEEILNNTKLIKEMDKNIDKLQKDEQQIKINLQNIRQSLTEKRTAYAETTERSRPIQYILQFKESGEISGILGRCGDYGQVEGKYDVPACTACGSTDQIVVESSDVAHACIQKLRVNKVGRLTFSILPQIQKLKPRADANNNYPENAKRVFDFIQILDQKFRLTFYSGLYDTLLAEDIEQARRIAFGTQTRYRVVTYRGDLIDQSGIMSGGGRPIKGKIGPQEIRSKCANTSASQVSQSEVENLDKITKELEQKLRNTQSNIFDCQANMEHYQRKIDDLNMIVKQCLSRINSWREKENQVKKLIEIQKEIIIQKKTDPVAVAKKEAEIKRAEKELEESEIEYHKIKSKMDMLKQKIEEITEGEPREAKRLLDEATVKLEQTRSGINQVTVDIQAAERQIKKSESQIKTLEDDVTECKERVESIKEKFKKNQDIIDELNEKLTEMNNNIDDQKNNIEEIKNKDDENLRRSNELRKEKIKLSQDWDTIEGERIKYSDQCKHLKLNLSKLKLHNIPKIDNTQRDPILESYQNRGDINKENKITPINKEQNSTELNKMDIEGQNNTEEVNDEDKNDTELVQYSNEELVELNYEDLEQNRCILTEELKKEKPNFGVLEEYKNRTRQYNEKADEVASVLKIYNDHSDMINKVRQRRKDEFMASFRKITIKLKEMYQMITLGGDAELELVDSLDPFSEGVNFSVRPPKKTWKVISNLSGGEKTLSSLALVFALHYYKPSPLYVMDEIDAALDFKNVSIIAYYIKMNIFSGTNQKFAVYYYFFTFKYV
ncbi:structural maintenance of chromosomes protein 4 isoform X2 [Daktulosphaira vitifoliae]|uniref:structural maintenance of chromosomes protein 4 isoform X2 n=1 Tax=Daktulosphaira vitifoliae TaxID=58002 RepID=UPI0021AADFE6|nr:structural maintenance of chromosomes protein 4 isoform X2 [Daktulosphaira vitifoliae]